MTLIQLLIISLQGYWFFMLDGNMKIQKNRLLKEKTCKLVSKVDIRSWIVLFLALCFIILKPMLSIPYFMKKSIYYSLARQVLARASSFNFFLLCQLRTNSNATEITTSKTEQVDQLNPLR